MKWPQIKLYSTWQEAFQALIKTLDQSAAVVPLRPPQYHSSNKPAATEAGLIVYFRDLEYCGLSHDGAWYKLHDPTTLVP